jgi:isoquinoline 1-oxidoreductase beta subunit
MGKWTRRAFITAGSVVGGGLVLGVAELALAPNRFGILPDPVGEAPMLTVWLTITPDNRVTVLVPHCEMGQGVHTALTMMAAEELDADWSLVGMREAPAEDAFANAHVFRGFLPFEIPPLLGRGFDYATFKLAQWVGLQVTGGSASVRGTGRHGMQVAGAAARAMLIETAAARWHVPAAECTAQLSRVAHTASGNSATYGELATDAAKRAPPVHPALKPREQYRIRGTSVPRFDIPAKVNGTAQYGIDVALPGMLYATVRAAPVFGGRLKSVDTLAVEALPGIKQVVQLDDAVAVVADGYWRALKAVRALAPVFDDAGHGAVDSAGLLAAQAAALDGTSLHKAAKTSEGAAALGRASQRVAAEYRVPYLAHATMEPMNATVRFIDGGCEVWAGTQDPLSARKVAAEAAGLKPDQVRFHNQPLGGGFGRRLPGAFDYIAQAVKIAKAVAPAPVKLIWSREEDMQHDYYRAAYVARLEGGLDAVGQVDSWVAKYTGADQMGAGRPPYRIANLELRTAEVTSHVREGSWRSVEFSQQGFFIESFIDELAHAAKQDPLAFRLAALPDSPRHRAVLEQVARLAGWGMPLPAGQGRGIALVEAFGSIVAEVAEIQISAGHTITVHKVTAVVDCGDLVNPDTAAAQVEGGIVFGLSAALYGQITIDKGRVVQGNFHDYPLVKLADAPRVTVEFIRSGAPLGGLGEPGVPPVAPAVANAIFAATGRRLRQLPLQGALRAVSEGSA